jgi:hypothetical protein
MFQKKWSELEKGEVFLLGMLFGWITLTLLILIGI